MASKPITLQVRPRGKALKKLPESTSTYLQGSTADLYHRIAAEAGCSVNQLRLTKGSDGSAIPNAKTVSIERTGLRNESTIYVKDLGPQIAWQTVFLIEYAGPLVILPLMYLLRPYVYANAPRSASAAQTTSCILIVVHFLKRELETLYMHRFSNATMPFRNIFKNSAHYWIFGGANIAYWIYRPDAPTAQDYHPHLVTFACFLFLIGELGNLSTHMTLRALRSDGGTERGIPDGLGFDLVTCPNYTFETIAWAGIWFMTWSWSTGIFVVIAVAQMAIWARKKEARYRKDFGDNYQKKRFGMIPGLF